MTDLVERLRSTATRGWEHRTLTEAAEEIERLQHTIDVARAECGAAIVQSLPSDDEIIMDHVREAFVLLGGDPNQFANVPPGGPERRPTVSELEAILARDDLDVQIKPDGSIEAVEKPKVKSLDEILDGVAEKRRTADY